LVYKLNYYSLLIFPAHFSLKNVGT